MMKSDFSKDRWYKYHRYVNEKYIVPVLEYLGIYRDEDYGILRYDDDDDEGFIKIENPNSPNEDGFFLALPRNDYEYTQWKKNKNVSIPLEVLSMHNGNDISGAKALFTLFMENFRDSVADTEFKHLLVQIPKYHKTLIYRLSPEKYASYMEKDGAVTDKDLKDCVFREFRCMRLDYPILLCIYELMKIGSPTEYYNEAHFSYQQGMEEKINKRLRIIFDTEVQEYSEKEYKRRLQMEDIYQKDGAIRKSIIGNKKAEKIVIYSDLGTPSISDRELRGKPLNVDINEEEQKEISNKYFDLLY